MAAIDWVRINSNLPHKRTKEQYEQRKTMWAAIDANENGFVSLAEISRVKIIKNSNLKINSLKISKL